MKYDVIIVMNGIIGYPKGLEHLREFGLTKEDLQEGEDTVLIELPETFPDSFGFAEKESRIPFLKRIEKNRMTSEEFPNIEIDMKRELPVIKYNGNQSVSEYVARLVPIGRQAFVKFAPESSLIESDIMGTVIIITGWKIENSLVQKALKKENYDKNHATDSEDLRLLSQMLEKSQEYEKSKYEKTTNGKELLSISETQDLANLTPLEYSLIEPIKRFGNSSRQNASSNSSPYSRQNDKSGKYDMFQ